LSFKAELNQKARQARANQNERLRNEGAGEAQSYQAKYESLYQDHLVVREELAALRRELALRDSPTKATKAEPATEPKKIPPDPRKTPR
jgi:phage shock protein A